MYLFIYFLLSCINYFTGIVWCYYYHYSYHYIFTKYLLVIFLSSVASVVCSLCQEPECLVALEALATPVDSSFIHRYIFTGIIRTLLLWLEARVPSASSGFLVLTGYCSRLAVAVAPWAGS